MRLYGNPGTAEGRKLGGIRSVAAQKKNPTGFVLLRHISFPRESVELAELFGILAGDGHINEYQVSMTTNSETDLEHALFVKSLFEKLFKIPVSFSLRKNQKACTVFISSKEAARFLVEKGACKGNKILGNIHMPEWIKTKKSYRLAFTRGLMDTDGCVYTDKHKIKGREYKNLGMAFANRSLPLLADFKVTLESLGLRPTQKSQYRLFLRREKDIQGYFAAVGSSNPKHLQKVTKYFSQKGGVA